jgi:hypothetical protein
VQVYVPASVKATVDNDSVLVKAELVVASVMPELI